MDGVASAPAFQLLRGLSEVFENLLIRELDVAVWPPDPDESVDAIDDQTKFLVALA